MKMNRYGEEVNRQLFATINSSVLFLLPFSHYHEILCLFSEGKKSHLEFFNRSILNETFSAQF